MREGVFQEHAGEVAELRWLQELRMRAYPAAAATLLRRATATAAAPGAPPLGQARRAACLAKLALLADQPGGLAPVSSEVQFPRSEACNLCALHGSCCVQNTRFCLSGGCCRSAAAPEQCLSCHDGRCKGCMCVQVHVTSRNSTDSQSEEQGARWQGHHSNVQVLFLYRYKCDDNKCMSLNVQASEGLDQADRALALMHAQQRLGRSDSPLLPAATLAEAALDVRTLTESVQRLEGSLLTVLSSPQHARAAWLGQKHAGAPISSRPKPELQSGRASQNTLLVAVQPCASL